MAMNVFGNPITNSSLEGMSEYCNNRLTRLDRARAALNMKNSEGKDVNAQRYVDKLKAAYGNGVSTKCMIYNATGDTVTYVLKHDWNGHLGQSPYPIEIANGQWGAFLHVPAISASTSSSGAVVYRGKNNNEVCCDWSFSWMTPSNTIDNKAFSEVSLAGHYEGDNWNWEWLLGSLNNSGLVQTFTSDIGCKTSASTGVGSSVSYVGIMTLQNA